MPNHIVFLMCVQIIATLVVGWGALIAVLGFIRRKPERGSAKPIHRFAVVVCARNEEKVLSHLLKSLEEQDYPKDAWHVYLLADHCTDGTAALASKYPFVTVYERNDGAESGKGAVLAWGIAKILREKADTFDALMTFDADNVAKNDFMSRMNEHLNKGDQLVQGNRLAGEPYRTFITKWYASYWPCYTLLYSYPREKLGLSCFLTGTGFVVTKKLLETYGWSTNSITEDVEFAFQQCLRHDRTSFCIDAVCYDEQPSSFVVMMRQLARWCTGSYQILYRYFRQWCRAFKEKPSIRLFDNLMLLLVGPGSSIQLIATIVLNIALALTPGMREMQFMQLLIFLLGYLGTIVAALVFPLYLGVKIRKLLPAAFFFQIFIYLYTLCSLYSFIFPQKKWKPIAHEGLMDEQDDVDIIDFSKDFPFFKK